jgi:23S rRNA (pseudouridine1915-N3)-methyltransferase
LKIDFLVVGKPKAGFVARGVDHYLTHLIGLASVKVLAVKPEPLVKGGDPDRIRRAEAERLRKRIRGTGLLAALDVTGKELSSKGLARKLANWEAAGTNRLSFVIGGPLGLDRSLVGKADAVLSLSRMTLSHELCLLMGLEQLYRALSINAGRPYAK